MPLLLPSFQAERIRNSIVDYLSTTFALTDAEPRRALAEFLEDEEQGVFAGPFARLRLPYVPASARPHALDWNPGIDPYRHQEDAYRRLTTKDSHRPEPTIVTTGTGSGKTEAFLHPILDHVLRARAEGVTGIKALILYPMNALAADQAGRLARLITSDAALARVRAALYTGDTSGSGRSHVTAGSLITDRYAIRDNPPDILLTNYKMLDQLLLRPEDRELWRASAPSLTYLVLDEFHTYDGAQGTDVAMLLRRLGLTLRAHLPADDPRQETYATSPLGPVCPVATSATLGDGNDPARVLDFARDVFGLTLSDDAVILETRTDLDTWVQPHREATEAMGLSSRARRLRELSEQRLTRLAGIAAHATPDPAELLSVVVDALYPPDPSLDEEDEEDTAAASPHPTGTTRQLSATDLAHAIQAHPDVVDLISLAQGATPLSELATTILGTARLSETAGRRRALATILAALSAIRAGVDGEPDRSAVNVEITMWIREITRVDRLLDSLPTFQWADAVTTGSDDAVARPALYCRSCGRSGWGIVLAPTGQGEKADQTTVRHDRLLGDSHFRALLSALGEEADYRRRASAGETDLDRIYPGLRWYSVDTRELLARMPDESALDTREGRYLPVLVLAGDDKTVADATTQDVCPSCGARDSIRFLGSAVATLLSVSLTTLFGDDALDDTEKRALIFTDSVQDAAHRAGFIDQRSHAMSLRSALRGALGAATSLDAWAEAALDAARASAFDRYRLVPAALAEHAQFKPYWDPRATARRRRTAVAHVRRRLLFDIAMEVGLQSTYGRTLEATGSITVHVKAKHPDALMKVARQVLGAGGQDALAGFESVNDAELRAWVRGILERMRRDGAIDHTWLDPYKQNDGKRVWIWYKRRRDQGQPAFPAGRSAPAFPQVGGSIDPRYSAFVPVTSAKSWYATWTRKCLRVAPNHAARLAGLLLAHLARAGILSTTRTNSGGTVYGIPPEQVVITPLDGAQTADLLLVCDTCRTQVPASAVSAGQLAGAPCLTARCPGRLRASRHPEASFYRSMYAGSGVRRVDAREHTSLLQADERAAVEAGFKRPEQELGDPNVLVATPTLEMGIDIGDLSTVMLGSLPETTASYVQRVGRAGRRNGSALALAYVPGRRSQTPLLDDPSRLLDGSVRPPSTYLGAEEILRRQFLAFVIDTLARQDHPAVPYGGHDHGTARTALGSAGDNSFIAAVGDHITNHGAPLAAAFTATFAERSAALERLVTWVTKDGGTEPRRLLHRAAAEYRAETEALRRQDQQIRAGLPELIAASERPNATEEDKRARRAAEGAQRTLIARRNDLEHEHWVAALERHGILPNYTLIDDTVQLSARVSWLDPDTDELRFAPCDINRASTLALHELVPGTTFYTHGLEMRVDGIDSSALADQAEWWLCCQACGYVSIHPAQPERPPAPAQCPRCGDTVIADIGRARRVLRLTRVFSDVSRDDARISDASDQRVSSPFEVLPLADFDPMRAAREWNVPASGFGLTRYRDMPLRWLNTGRPRPGQAIDRIAHRPVSSRSFRLCEACGKLDTDTGASTPREHRPWCEHRNDPTEHVVTVDLMRDLTTEALALVLPLGFATDDIGVASLAAALKLGLDITTGGAPDHLGIVSVPYPVADGDPGETRPTLLLHDTVPGGTGYLTDLDAPEVMWDLLVRVGHHLEACQCAHEGKTMCHRCLQPYAVGTEPTRAAALHAIRQVLGVDEDALADLEPDSPAWKVVNQPVSVGTGESPLEVRFRAELVARLEQDAAVRITSDRSGAPGLQIDGGRWAVHPQLDLAGCRPDFTCLSPGGAAGIAVFTDGHAFHAAPARNRLADDASKRATLRAAGYRVIALSAEDFDRPWEPGWLSYDAITMLKNGTAQAARAGSVTDQAVATWRGGPMTLLVDMLLDDASGSGPQATALSALADCIWAPLLIGAAQGGSAAHGGALAYHPVGGQITDPLWNAAQTLRPDLEPPAGEPSGSGSTASVFTRPHLALAVQLQGTSTTGIALVLDDSLQALESPDHAEAWRMWLRLSNVLALAQAPVTITTTSLAVDELNVRAALDASSDTAIAADDLRRLGWDAVDPELTPRSILALITHLARAGVPHEADGVEVEGGIMTDLSWRKARIAVLAEPYDEDITALDDAGWHVVLVEEDPARTAAEIARLLEGH